MDFICALLRLSAVQSKLAAFSVISVSSVDRFGCGLASFPTFW
jgi:hypothetical protein